MSVLIACASAETPSTEVAEQIADRLLKAGVAAVVRPIDRIESIRPYRAVVLGVRGQEWQPAAVHFRDRFSNELASLPCWLFSTGSLAKTGSRLPALDRTCVARAAPGSARDPIRFRGYRHFTGAFERSTWSSLSDLFLKICGGCPEDRRNWQEINEWTAEIAREIQAIDHLRERRRLHLSVRGRP